MSDFDEENFGDWVNELAGEYVESWVGPMVAKSVSEKLSHQQQAIDALSLEWAKQQARIQALEKAAQRRVDCGHDDECGGRQKDRCGCGHTELENALEMLLP